VTVCPHDRQPEPRRLWSARGLVALGCFLAGGWIAIASGSHGVSSAGSALGLAGYVACLRITRSWYVLGG